MLGEKIGEFNGKITGLRVLPSEGRLAMLEVAEQSSGKLLGVECNELCSYRSKTEADGTLSGEGEGIVTTKDGEVSTFTGVAAGRRGARGAMSWRGCLVYHAAGKLARLNGTCVIFEYDIDEQGQGQSRLFEWK